jgi:hypothetical protein
MKNGRRKKVIMMNYVDDDIDELFSLANKQK